MAALAPPPGPPDPRSIAPTLAPPVPQLWTHGLGDRETFELALVTAYFNYANRVAEGLGVEPAPTA